VGNIGPGRAIKAVWLPDNLFHYTAQVTGPDMAAAVTAAITADDHCLEPLVAPAANVEVIQTFNTMAVPLETPHTC
jgi:hypothetical protein